MCGLKQNKIYLNWMWLRMPNDHTYAAKDNGNEQAMLVENYSSVL